MPKGSGRKDVACSHCGTVFRVNNACVAGVFRCNGCPVRCSACGDNVPRVTGRIRPDRQCKRCSAMRQRKARERGASAYSVARSIASRRGFDWLLSQGEYVALRSQPCHYCGWPLPLTGMGIDRIDSRLGYLPGNVVPCCTDCNLAKNANFTHDEMLLIGAVVAQIKADRQQRGEGAPQGHRSVGAPRKY